MIYSHLIFNRLEYCHPKTWISVIPQINGARPARLYCEEPNNQPTRSSQVTPAMLREWRRCFVWRWPWCGSFIKIMTGVIFLKDVKHSKNICNKLLCVCFLKRPSLKSNTVFFIYNGPGQFTGCIANVAWSCSTPITGIAQWWNWGGQPTSLGSFNATGGVERKCLISEVSQNIPKTKIAMKNPPWMKRYFLIFHWHFFVFTWRTKKLMLRFFWVKFPYLAFLQDRHRYLQNNSEPETVITLEGTGVDRAIWSHTPQTNSELKPRKIPLHWKMKFPKSGIVHFQRQKLLVSGSVAGCNR